MTTRSPRASSTELIADRVWRTQSQLELAVVAYVGWFNNERLHESRGDIPPAEKVSIVTDKFFLDTHYSEKASPASTAYASSRDGEGGYHNPLAGLSEASFRMTLPGLMTALETTGFHVTQEHVVADWGPV
jgi:hypothetical protein